MDDFTGNKTLTPTPNPTGTPDRSSFETFEEEKDQGIQSHIKM